MPPPQPCVRSSRPAVPRRSPRSTRSRSPTSRPCVRTSARRRAQPFDRVADGRQSWAASLPGTDVVLVLGPEPALRWRTFCEQIIGIAQRMGAPTAFTLGSVARRRATHPAHPAHRDCDRQLADRTVRTRALSLRGPDRHRRGAARCAVRAAGCRPRRCGRPCRATPPSCHRRARRSPCSIVSAR